MAKELGTINMNSVEPSGVSNTQLAQNKALTHPDLPHNGPGRAFNSNFVLNEIKLFQQVGNKWVPVPLAEAKGIILNGV